MMVCKRRAAQGTGDWPSIQLYNAVLARARPRKRRAIALLDQQADGVPVDAVTYNICLREVGEARGGVFSYDGHPRAARPRGGRRRRHTRDDGEGTAAAALDVLDRCVAGASTEQCVPHRAQRRRPPDDDPPPFARAILGLDVARMNRAGYRRSDLDGATLGRLAKAPSQRSTDRHDDRASPRARPPPAE
ncbi:endonuclease [Aureococcus anophagefferens]|nr:endonuclease [Aureococcus anophagefferens]